MDTVLLIFAPMLLLLVILVPAIIIWRRMSSQHARLQSMQNDLRALCSAAVSMGERIGNIERRQQQLSSQQQELGKRQQQLQQKVPDAQAYAQAIKLAHKGADVDDLVEACGLSRGEAELVAMMHRLER